MRILIKINYWLQRNELFKNVYNKRLNNIENLSKKVDYNDLKVSSGLETHFSELQDLVTFPDDIKTNKVLIERVQYKKKNLTNI